MKHGQKLRRGGYVVWFVGFSRKPRYVSGVTPFDFSVANLAHAHVFDTYAQAEEARERQAWRVHIDEVWWAYVD